MPKPHQPKPHQNSEKPRTEKCANHSTAPTLRDAPKRALRTAAVLTVVAAAATAASVSSGVLSAPAGSSASDDVARVASAATGLSADELERRSAPTISRSDRRDADDRRTADRSSADPRDVARALLPEYGFAGSEFSCLDSLYVSESNWRVDADNPTSSAYGIPQALTSMHELPADYRTSAESQIRWGLGYIQDTYGTPCNAWSFKQGHGWY